MKNGWDDGRPPGKRRRKGVFFQESLPWITSRREALFGAGESGPTIALLNKQGADHGRRAAPRP